MPTQVLSPGTLDALADTFGGVLVTPEDAAYGAHQIAASNMIRAIRAVSSERGRDPHPGGPEKRVAPAVPALEFFRHRTWLVANHRTRG